MEEYSSLEVFKGQGGRPKPILLKMGYGESIPDLSWSVCGIDSAVSTSQAISGSFSNLVYRFLGMLPLHCSNP